MTTKYNNSTAAELVRRPNTAISIIIVSTDIDNLHSGPIATMFPKQHQIFSLWLKNLRIYNDCIKEGNLAQYII